MRFVKVNVGSDHSVLIAPFAIIAITTLGSGTRVKLVDGTEYNLTDSLDELLLTIDKADNPYKYDEDGNLRPEDDLKASALGTVEEATTDEPQPDPAVNTEEANDVPVKKSRR